MFVVNVEGAVTRGDRWLVIERGAGEEHAAGTLSFVGGTVEQERFKDASIKGTPVWTSPFYFRQSAFGSLVPIGNSAAEDAGYASLQMVH